MTIQTIVLKFGSSVLASAADIPTAVHEIYRWYRDGWRVVAVVSAIGETTERLRAEAHAFGVDPHPHSTAELLATGERHSAALMGIALDRAGITARVVDPREIHLMTSGAALDSEPVAVDRTRLDVLLREAPVLVVPGFFGHDGTGRLHLLGRGGSDLSAVYLAAALGAQRCRLLKDVDGVYECDPALPAATPLRRFVALSYAEAIERATQVVQPKAVRFLERHSGRVEVASIASGYESVIGPVDRDLAESKTTTPSRVLLLGLGTVGLGVYQRLSAMPNQFSVVGVLVRDRAKHASLPAELLHDTPASLMNVQADIVIDALAGLEPSRSLIRHFLEQGVAVVSANKAAIADNDLALTAVAVQHRSSLRYSAAVGGSTPMIEMLEHEAQCGAIQAISGVLNGTCNYILDLCADGLTFDDAVRDAQANGFAEADPSADLSGQDAARKLRILAHAAFGQAPRHIDIEALDAATLSRRRETLRDVEVLRLIARAWQHDGRIVGRIQLEAVAAHDGFAHTRREWNRLVITHVNQREVVVHGRGAGRWPTTEAVVADVLQLRRAISTANSEQVSPVPLAAQELGPASRLI